MAQQTKISWADSSINFWSGCTKVSPGCANCYAEVRDRRHMIEPVSHWGKGAKRLKHKGAVKDALALNRMPWVCECGNWATRYPPYGKTTCVKCGKQMHRRRIFSLSLGDWLDEEVPIEWLAEMLDTIRQCDQVTWILCTKRPENFFSRLKEVTGSVCGASTHNWICDWLDGSNPPSNIIILTSVENQEQADKRIPELLNIPAVCRGLSLEPLLGPVMLPEQVLGSGVLDLGNSQNPEPRTQNRIDWLILGGESGPGARPCNVDWIRSLVGHGKAAGVATFVKQLGANVISNGITIPGEHWPNGFVACEQVGNLFRHLIIDKKGGDPAEWPADLRVQEWPAGNVPVRNNAKPEVPA